MRQLPLAASEIFADWVTDEGGVGVIALTDETRLPYIGLYPITWTGQVGGLPCWFQKSRLMSDIVIGFRKREPLVIFIDVEVNRRGLSLIACAPPDIAPRGYQRHVFTPWGSEPPRYGYAILPANSNWPFPPLPLDELF